MSTVVPDRRARSLSYQASETEPLRGSLLVYLHHQEQICIASFRGALSTATRTTVDGIADLIAGEGSVVLDFSRADVVDDGGADAVEALVHSIRTQGAHLQMAAPRTRLGGPLSGRTSETTGVSVGHEHLRDRNPAWL